jgi:hypothetical protein
MAGRHKASIHRPGWSSTSPPRCSRRLRAASPGCARAAAAGPDLLAALRHGQDELGEAVLIADQATRRVLYASAGTREVFGRAPEALLGEDWMPPSRRGRCGGVPGRADSPRTSTRH